MENADEFKKYIENAKKEFEIQRSNAEWENAALDDFERLKTIGKGGYGTVMLVQSKKEKTYYAMKIMKKCEIKKKGTILNVIQEKNILKMTEFPFLIHLKSHFQDFSNIYLIMEYIPGGNMFSFKPFTEKIAKFLASQIVLSLEYLHSLNIIHRDLKPENILINCDGYIKVTDFGIAKEALLSKTFCGTPLYIAPEMLLKKMYGPTVDWWAFGVLLFEISAGYTPFYVPNIMKIYENIIFGRVEYPENFSQELQSLIHNLLQVDLTKRYGNLKNGVTDIKNSSWFENTNWISIFEKRENPPFKPHVTSPDDTSNFKNYEEEPLIIDSENQFGNDFEYF